MKTRALMLAAAALAAAVVPAAAATATMGPEAVKAEVATFDDLYRALTTYHILLQGDRATRPVVESALYDVERYVEEIDGRYATDQLFVADKDALDELRLTTAKAHLEAALLDARGVDIESSVSHYEKAVALYGPNIAEWDVRIPRTARPGTLPGAVDAAYEMATVAEVLEDLKNFWSSGVMVRFKIREFQPAQRATLRLERAGGAGNDFARASFDVAAARFAARAAAGADEIRVALPAGSYRVVSGDPAVKPLSFAALAGSAPDPIVLNPNRFSFELSPDERCRPELTLNGLPINDVRDVPYGSYRVVAPKGCPERLPNKVVVDQSPNVTVRTEPDRLDYVREGQPIFLFVTTPPGSVFKLKM